jgi:AcrR family transcriptional regulator
LSLRTVARAVSISPTSVYLYFPDRDALVAATMQRCHAEVVRAADDAEAAHQDPALGVRARILAQAAWVREHPGLYKVMHESKVGMPFKEILFTRTTAAVQRRMAWPALAALPRASRSIPLQARRTRAAGRRDDSLAPAPGPLKRYPASRVDHCRYHPHGIRSLPCR